MTLSSLPQDQPPPELTDRQRVFVETYLRCWNASQAAREAGYAVRQQGWENLSNPVIQAYIQHRLAELKMAADEVLIRLTSQARGDLGEFLSADGSIDLDGARRKGLTHLIKRYKRKVRNSEDGETLEQEIELYDAQAALVHLGKQLGLFREKADVHLTWGEERRNHAAEEIAAGLGLDGLEEQDPGTELPG